MKIPPTDCSKHASERASCILHLAHALFATPPQTWIRHHWLEQRHFGTEGLILSRYFGLFFGILSFRNTRQSPSQTDVLPGHSSSLHSNNVSCTTPILQTAEALLNRLLLSESGRRRAPVLLCMCFSDVGKAAVCAAVPNNAFHQCFKNVLALWPSVYVTASQSTIHVSDRFLVDLSTFPIQ